MEYKKCNKVKRLWRTKRKYLGGNKDKNIHFHIYS